jgi:hypothetical protein
MNHATVEGIISSFPHPMLPIVQGKPEYQTIHAIQKLLQANIRAIGTHLGDGALGHLSIIISDAVYAIVAPTHPWANPAAPGRGPEVIAAGAAAQISAAGHLW